MKRIIINHESLQTRIALTEDGVIQEYYFEREDSSRITHSIYKGRIRNLEPSLQAAFVDIGLTKNAFLHYWDMLPATKEMLESDEPDLAPEPAEEEEKPAAPREAPPPRQQQGAKKKKKPAPPKGLKGKLFKLVGWVKEEPEPPSEQSSEQPRSRKDRGKSRKNGRKQNDSRNRSSRRGNSRGKRERTIGVEEIPDRFPVNSEVIVQVSKGMIGEKGPRVTTNLSIPGRYVVLLPNSSHRGVSKKIPDNKERTRLRKIIAHLDLPPGVGCICRTAGDGLDEETIRADVDMLLEKWAHAEDLIKNKRAPVCVYSEPSLVERTLRDLLTQDLDEIIVDAREMQQTALAYVRRLDSKDRTKVKLYNSPTPIFQHFHLTEQISDFYNRKVKLASGAELCIDETEALIAIDINSGKSRGGKDHPETILNTNLEAADEIARQLRLRNIGGLVVVDFIDMRSRKDQAEVYRRMKEALTRDHARTRILPISRLGLMEMTRQREHESLQSEIFEPCSYCNGKGRIKSSLTISVEIQRRIRELLRRQKRTIPLRVMVHPAILRRLKNEDADILMQLEKEYDGELSFRADSACHVEDFTVINQETGKKI